MKLLSYSWVKNLCNFFVVLGKQTFSN